MKVILLERVEKLGIIGEVVDVKVGYARNFLLPKGKALRATEANLEFFANKKAEIEATNLKQKAEAEKIAAKIGDVSLVLIRQASESGFLFGSVRPTDIVSALSEKGFYITKNQVRIEHPIKTIGSYLVNIALHPEVIVGVPIRVMTAQEQGAVNMEEDAAVVAE